MRTPVANESPVASVLTKCVDDTVIETWAELRHRLYVALVTDALSEYSYDADLAGLTYSFEASSLGFYVAVTGYNDKLHVLLRDVLGKAKSLEVCADRLEVMKEKVNDVLRLPSNTQLRGLTSKHRSNEIGRTFTSAKAVDYQITTDGTL